MFICGNNFSSLRLRPCRSRPGELDQAPAGYGYRRPGADSNANACVQPDHHAAPLSYPYPFRDTHRYPDIHRYG